MHKKNKHLSGYDLKALTRVNPDLIPFIVENHGKKSIDFFNPKAVKALNKALLKKHYNISFWEFPDQYLCPPIPGRVDYIHHINDILNKSKLSKNIKVLDVGVGASCIYPLLGYAEYNWNFVGSDCHLDSINSAKNIIDKNNLNACIGLRHQPNKVHLFEGILTKNDAFSITICNPPFYKSASEALEATTKKMKGLGHQTDKVVRNFSGADNELWYKGGEKAFLHTYLYESSLYKKQSFWFTTLVSNKTHVKGIYNSLKKLKATELVTIDMVLGNKKSRIIAWTFLTKDEQKEWINI